MACVERSYKGTSGPLKEPINALLDSLWFSRIAFAWPR
jgi:hypothetical protein